MIGIVNYGVGNLNSITNMIRAAGGESRILSREEELAGITKIILPGVGAFDHGMNCLVNSGWVGPLNDIVTKGDIPILGICLGMQLMCRSSEEGVLPGLGWFDAVVRRIDPGAGKRLKVPHMGWNTVEVVKENDLLSHEGVGSVQRFYFVHSYHVDAKKEDVAAIVQYGNPLVAAISRGRLFGVQFHPEKSHRFGKSLIRKYVNLL